MSEVLAGYQVELHPVEASHLELLRAWRNDPAISQFMLSDDKISEEQQLAWFKKIQRDNAQRHFVIYYKGNPIGSANIKACGVNVSLAQAKVIEPGLYIGEEKYRHNILAFSPTLVLNDYCFDVLGVEKLIAVVKANNQAALKYNQQLGYKIVNQGDLIDISLNFKDYQQHSKQLKAFLSR